MKITVYQSPISEKVIHEFNSADSFISFINGPEPSDWFADQIAIDGMVMLGWDEIEEKLMTALNL